MILDHLLAIPLSTESSTLISDDQNIYKTRIHDCGIASVSRYLLGALTPEIENVYKEGLFDFRALSLLDRYKADKYVWPGVYQHVIYDPGHPGVYWLYVGAAIHVANRLREHRLYRHTPSRDCLHYRIWNMSGREDIFILLGGFQGLQHSNQLQITLNNLLEELSCLVWQTLPSAILKKAVPKEISVCQPRIHLDRASPLRQIYNFGPPGHHNIEAANELAVGALELSNSEDPEIRDYFEQRRRFKDLPKWRKAEGGRLSHVALRKTGYKSFILASRKRSSCISHLRRDADASQGDIIEVLIRCKRWKHSETYHIDPAPWYEIATGRYIERKSACMKCPAIFGRRRYGSDTLENFSEQIDPSIPSVSIYTLYNFIDSLNGGRIKKI